MGFSGVHFHLMGKTLPPDKYNKATDASLSSSLNIDRLCKLCSPGGQSIQGEKHVPTNHHKKHKYPKCDVIREKQYNLETLQTGMFLTYIRNIGPLSALN